LLEGKVHHVLQGISDPQLSVISQDPYTVGLIYDRKTKFEELKQTIEQQIAERQGPAEVLASPNLPGPAVLEFEVRGEPTRILSMIRGYFESDEWPYREKSKVITGRGGLLARQDPSTKNRLACVVDQPFNRIGCLVWLTLFVVTLGSAIIVWLIWVIFERMYFLPQVVVTAYPESPGVSRVTLAAEKKPEYAEPIAAWIQRELVEKTRAAEAPQQTTPPEIREGIATQQPMSNTNSGDVFDQIRKLAELRDAGAISAEEFETKKSELLNRM
jgi:hypothetical protein